MSEQTTETQFFPCAGCGSRVEFAPGTRSLRCPYCGYEQAIGDAGKEIQEHSYDEWQASARKPVALVGQYVFVCQGCGARTETDKQSDRCQFCGAPVVAESNPAELIAPEVVLPFALGQSDVRDRFQKWVKSRWFAPSSLKKVGATERLAGTYLPHWTYDTNTTTDYAGQRGEHYWVTETYTENVDGQQVTRTRQVQKTRWYPASGQVRRAFDDVLVPATTTMPERQLVKLSPWALSNGVAYQPQFLSGYRTLRYDVEPNNGLESAKAIMKPVIEKDCRADIGGDEQRVSRMDIHYAAIMFKLVLLPVWIAAYLHHGKTFQVLVNAATGEVIGERPYSVGKIVGAVALVLAVIVTILVVYAQVK